MRTPTEVIERLIIRRKQEIGPTRVVIDDAIRCIEYLTARQDRDLSNNSDILISVADDETVIQAIERTFEFSLVPWQKPKIKKKYG